jgi:superfamily II DNA or RNA helicase
VDPIKASAEIESVLRDYVRRALPVERADPSMTHLIDELFQEHRFLLPHYLELLPTYKRGPTLQDLVAEQTIRQATANIFAAALVGDASAAPQFRLYEHQAEAIRAVATNDQNLIVCSGTGSGKTECFLIPLIEHLVRMNEEGNLKGAGVQAMILYPMNALVNDQIRRLRKVLQHYPDIRFGKFTGELDPLGDEETVGVPDNNVLGRLAEQHTVNWTGAGFDDEAALPNEVTSRREWFRNPAHILVTNYSMLERLLLKPQSTNLFESQWKFIVLDEAHCYDGGLGTEIAWLLRRLKKRLGNPQGLRFMATSATLIDDPALNEEEKRNQIQSDFGSQLFPAPAKSFSVQFGQVQPFEPPDSSHLWAAPCGPTGYQQIAEASLTEQENNKVQECLADAEGLMQISDGSLFHLTQQLLGAERWLEGLLCAERLAAGAEGPMALGDVAYLVEHVHAAVSPGLVAIPCPTHLERGFISFESTGVIQGLLQFLESVVADLSDRDAWREWLHDHADPSGSSDPTDMVRPNWLPANHPGFRHRVGNRLHLRDEWRLAMDGDLSHLSCDGLTYLLRASIKAAVLLESQDIDNAPVVRGLAVEFTNDAIDQLTAFRNAVSSTRENLYAIRSVCTSAWCRVAQGVSGAATPANIPLEGIVSWLLGGDSTVAALARHLEESVTIAGKTEECRFDRVATSVLIDDHGCGLAPQQSLAQLISLCSLAVPASPLGNKRPLLDLRYHQLARGISEVGVVLQCTEADVGRPIKLLRRDDDVLMVEGSPRAVFTLGACRDCGQPFAMGYGKQLEINAGAGIVSLSRVPTDAAPYLHAFVWTVGAPPADADDVPTQPNAASIWLNITSGQATAGPRPADDGWVAIQAYRHGTAERPAFIAECPCCGGAQQATTGTHFGLVTPYEASGDQFRLVLLDALYRQVDPSSDPQARRHEGAGRKLLAFSDSRKAAASLSLRYQEWAADTDLGRLIPLTISDFTTLTVADLLPDLREGFLRALFNGVMPDPDFMPPDAVNAMLQNALEQPATLKHQAVLFSHQLMTKWNAGRLLEVSSAEGGDLPPSEAAAVRLLQGLRSGSRYSVVATGRIRVGSRVMSRAGQMQPTDPRWPAWQTLHRLVADPDGILPLCNAIYKELFRAARIRGSSDWPDDLINSKWKKGISRDNAPRAMRFVTDSHASVLNGIVRDHLGLPNDRNGRNTAKQCLESIWLLLTLGGRPALVRQNQNGAYELNWEDVTIHEGTNADGVRPAFPHERFDDYLNTRERINARIEEHTAQISSDQGAAYQRAFSQGRVNMLSCSTTFEMGVDLGDLNCVFLANLPPSVANYRQRAGRAGRRPGAAAYVVAFVSDTPHDRYYFQYPTRLFFGRVETPRIYLTNKLFRARHLRAEALHDFLTTVPPVVNAVNPMRDNQIREKRLNWERAGDFFAGRMHSFVNVNGQRQYGITAVFEPIVSRLRAWHRGRHDVLQQQVNAIDDVNLAGDLDYGVADDLVWQIGVPGDSSEFSPYELVFGERHRFLSLAGPCQPEPEQIAAADAQTPLCKPADFLKREVFERFCQTYRAQGEWGDRFEWDNAAPGGVTGGQRHMLQESTLTWLTRNRVLPKYGFPVDVIRLLPDEADQYAHSIELERDLTQGLFEYAPLQRVIADKRVFESRTVVSFGPGGLPAAVAYGEQIYLCEGCREIKMEPPAMNKCDSCDGILAQWTVVKPDAFQANPSRAGGVGLTPPRGVPRQIYHGGVDHVLPVPTLRLRTAESRNGELWYFNFGSGYAGFTGPQGRYGLWHPVKTDIAIWLPSAEIFVQAPFGDWDHNRRKYAMESTMQAILRSTSICLEVADRDIGGLLYPDHAYLGEGFGFVLFDTSSGGGGAVLPLILGSGSPDEDIRRVALIVRILHTARELCITCHHCNSTHPGVDATASPLTAAEYRITPIEHRANIRTAESCYDCLRSYRNQRSHDRLDRHDAIALLTAILTAGDPASPEPYRQQNQIDGQSFALPAAAKAVFDGPRLRGLPQSCDPRYQRLSANDAIPARSLCVIRYGNDYVVARVQPGLMGGWTCYAATASAGFVEFTMNPEQRDLLVAIVAP